MKLNLGCGTNRIEGFINVDIDPSVGADENFSLLGKFPYADESIAEVVAYHILEHIPKHFHSQIYSEIYRVLEPTGKLTLSFPEWSTCVKYYQENYKGMKDFWEATLYGRQATPHDFHVCIMERDNVARELIRQGFEIDFCGTEPVELHNAVVKAHKVKKYTYQEAMKEALYANCES